MNEAGFIVGNCVCLDIQLKTHPQTHHQELHMQPPIALNPLEIRQKTPTTSPHRVLSQPPIAL